MRNLTIIQGIKAYEYNLESVKNDYIPICNNPAKNIRYHRR